MHALCTIIINRTRKRKLEKKIVKLKELSKAPWDEEKCMIVLDHEHYANHVKCVYFTAR